jgi:DUF971 family protein
VQVGEALLTASFAAGQLVSIPAHTLRGYEPSAGRGDARRTVAAAAATVTLTVRINIMHTVDEKPSTSPYRF